MGCGASKRAKDDVIPLQGALAAAEKKQDAKEKGNKKSKTLTNKDENADIYANTAVEDYKNKSNKEFLELSNLSDLPDYQAENPNFGFKNGELSPIDLNRNANGNFGKVAGNLDKVQKRIAGSQHLIADQENKVSGSLKEQQRGRIVRVKLKRNEELKWPEMGEIEIKTISYKVVYSHEAKGFRVLKSKDYYLTSLLSWKKDMEEDLFDFTIRDTASTHLRSGNTQRLSTPPLNFQVNYDGKFIGVKDLDSFVDSVLSLQSAGKITKNKQLLLQKTITKEIEKTWNLMVQEWVAENRIGSQNPLVEKREQFGKDCALFNRTRVSDDTEYRNKLKEKLMDSQSFYKLLSSSKMIKDKFKKWELHKDSTPKARNVYLDQGEPSAHRNLKLNFISTDKNEVLTVLNDPILMRPLISNYENSKNIVFEVNRDIYVDVEYEAKMSIYQWNDIKELDSDDFLISEMVNFQDACDNAVGDLLTEISSVPKIPLKYRVNNQVEEKLKVEEIQKVNLSKIR